MIPGSSLQEVLKDVDNARHAFAKALGTWQEAADELHEAYFGPAMSFSPKAASGAAGGKAQTGGLLGDVTLHTKSLGHGESVREWPRSGMYGSDQALLRKDVREKLSAATEQHHHLRMALEELRQHVQDSQQPGYGYDSGALKELKDALAQAEATMGSFKEALHEREMRSIRQMRYVSEALERAKLDAKRQLHTFRADAKAAERSAEKAAKQVRVRRSEKEQQLELLKKVKTMEDLKEVPQVIYYAKNMARSRSASEASLAKNARHGNHHELHAEVEKLRKEAENLRLLREALGDYALLHGAGFGAKRGGLPSNRYGVEGRELQKHTNTLVRATGCAGGRRVMDMATWKARFGEPERETRWAKWRSDQAQVKPWKHDAYADDDF